MTQRLPNPGGDVGNWGDILNAFLEVSHNGDGTLASNSVGTSQIASSAVTSAQLDAPTQSAITKANSSVQTVNSISPSGGNVSLTAANINAIPSSQLSAASGVAQLDGTSKLVSAQIPTTVSNAVTKANSSVQTVNNASPDGSGNVSLTASSVSAIPSSALGALSGVAQLDGTGKLTSGQIPVSVSAAIQVEQNGSYTQGQVYVGVDSPGALSNASVWINPSSASPDIQELRYQLNVLSDKPAGFWLLNEAIGLPQDASGNGNHVTSLTGTPTYNGVASGMTFTAAGAVILSVPSATSLNMGDIWTIEAWVKPINDTSSKGILGKGTGASYAFMESGAGSNNIPVLCKDDSTGIVFGSTIVPSDGNWHHMVFTKSGVNANLYMDGTLNNSTTSASVTTISNSSPLTIAAYSSSDNSYFGGGLKWISYYPTVLAANRVYAHYQAGS